MTIVVTRNSPGRFRGFLASCMCEIGPGVYTAPRMNTGVRERVWKVLSEWFTPGGDNSILMTWGDSTLPGGQQVLTLGVPRQELLEHDGVYLSRRELDDAMMKRLEALDGTGCTPPIGVA